MKQMLVTGLVLTGLLAGCAAGSRKKESRGGAEKARALFEAGRYEEAISACSGNSSLDADLYLLRGRCHEALGNSASALADFRAGREESPDRGEPYCREAHLLLATGRVEDALLVMQQAGMRLPGMSHRERFYVEATTGEVFLVGGDPESARDHLRKAIAIGDSSPFRNPRAISIAWHNLSRAEFELAAFRSARKSYDRYLHGKGRAGAEISPEDRYTEMTLRLLTGDIRGAQRIAADLPDQLRKHADSLLVGDALSVRDLVDTEKKRR